MMSFSLLFRQFFKQKLQINSKGVKILSLGIDTSPALMLEEGYYPGWRPVSKKELFCFAQKYKPAKWFPPVLGMDQEIESTIFGPMTMLYRTNGSRVEKSNQNLMRGLPAGTFVLFMEI